MQRFLLTLVCCALVLFAGLVHGVWTNRWQSSEALEQALVRVAEVPRSVGDWQSEDLEVEADLFARAGAQAFWMRSYRHAKTGETISVILMCGRGGQMAVHTPDVCYQGAGYGLAAPAKKYTIPLTNAPKAEFWTGNFVKEKAVEAEQLRLYWAWNADGPWQAPDVPRFTFRGQPFLYKLYVIRQCGPGAVNPESDPTNLFLQELLPQLNKTLFSQSLS